MVKSGFGRMVRYPPGFLGVRFFRWIPVALCFWIPAFAGMTRLGAYDVGFKGLRLEYIIFCGGGDFTLLDGFEGEVIVGDC
ncbi:hypothetical protein NEIFLAOT_01885 [Neisseria flavescens NRL30031/H210]|uniref:Uncharacterized protein n=1 Tax=Neisseria flavescens NRL30031/H210 TaxID=546264 RepID=C0EPJ5_NEIFL|nr:hypothetical protein NEIFLAOT_01885 [Neisseria flavescens NRL30031/H210]